MLSKKLKKKYEKAHQYLLLHLWYAGVGVAYLAFYRHQGCNQNPNHAQYLADKVKWLRTLVQPGCEHGCCQLPLNFT